MAPPDHVYTTARRLHGEARNDLAEEMILAALDGGTRRAALLTVLASTYHALGRAEDCLAAALAACLTEPPTAGRLCDLGTLCERHGLLLDAQVCYTAALDIESQHFRSKDRLRTVLAQIARQGDIAQTVRAAFLEGARLIRAGKLDAVLELAARLDLLAPARGAGAFLRGAVLEREGRLDEAVRAYSDAEVCDGPRARAAALRVRQRMAEQRQQKAVPLVEQIEELLAAGRDEEAARVAARLVGVLPDSPGPYLVWARLAERKGLTENAVQNLEHALVRATWGREIIARRIAELRTGSPVKVAGIDVEEIAS